MLRSALIGLPILYYLLADSPAREWPRWLWGWLRELPHLEDRVGDFSAVYRERTWPATPDAIEQTCAYVVLTTRKWARYHVGVFADARPLLFADTGERDAREVLEDIRRGVEEALPGPRTVSVALTRLRPAATRPGSG